jgi:hypothetical protein
LPKRVLHIMIPCSLLAHSMNAWPERWSFSNPQCGNGCQLQLALPMLHGHVMNIIHMYVYFFNVYAVYIYI